MSSCFFTCLPVLDTVCLLHCSHPAEWGESQLLWGLICIFLMTDELCIFFMSAEHLDILLWSVCSVLLPVFPIGCFFFPYQFVRVPKYYGYETYWICNIFRLRRLLFHSPDDVFWKTKVLQCNVVQFIIYSLMVLLLKFFSFLFSFNCYLLGT